MLELKIAVALLVSKFNFKMTEEMDTEDKIRAAETMALTLHARNGIKCYCKIRTADMTQ